MTADLEEVVMGWRRVWRQAAAVTALMVVAGGCGGSQAGTSSDQQAVKRTARTYLKDFADGNGTQACGLTTAAAKSYMTSTLAAKTGHSLSCEQIIALVGRTLPANVKAGLRTAVINKVTITGTTATIRDQDITSATGNVRSFLTSGSPTKLTKVNGVWLVTH